MHLPWITASIIAILFGLVVGRVAYRLYIPPDPFQDLQFAANELATHGERLQSTGDWAKARQAYDRARAVLGSECDKVLQGAVLGRLAISEKELGDFPAALAHYREALALAETLGDTSGEANRLNNIASLLVDQLASPQEALPYARLAAEKARIVGIPIRHAMMLTNLSRVEREMGSLDDALQHAEEAIGIGNASNFPDGLADGLYARGCVRIDRKEYVQAGSDFHEARRQLTRNAPDGLASAIDRGIASVRTALEKGEDVVIVPPAAVKEGEENWGCHLSPKVQDALQVALTHLESGRLELAARAFVVGMENEAVRNDAQAFAFASANLGDVLRCLGRVNEAESVLRKGIERCVQAKDVTIECASRLNLALSLRAKGALKEASKELDRALGLSSVSADKVIRGRILTAQGNILRDSCEFAAAKEKYQEALHAARIVGDEACLGSLALTLGNLAVKMYSYPEARAAFAEALDIAIRLRDSDLQGKALHMLGNVDKRLAQTEADPTKRDLLLGNAMQAVQRSIDLARTSGGRDGLQLRLQSLGELMSTQGNEGEALVALNQALAMCQREEIATSDVAHLREWIGVLMARRGDFEGAAMHLLQAHEIDLVSLREQFNLGSEEARLDLADRARGRFDTLLSLICRGGALESHRKVQHACADAIVRRKGLVLETAMLSRQIVRSEGRIGGIGGQLKELSDLRFRLALHALIRAIGRTVSSPGADLNDARARCMALEVEIAKFVSDKSGISKWSDVSAENIANVLEADTVLVEFQRFRRFEFPRPDIHSAWMPARYLGIVISGRRPDNLRIIDFGEARLIDSLVTDLRKEISVEPLDDDTWRKSAEKLSRILLDPLKLDFAATKSLIFSLDGNLCRLPFGVLLLKDGALLVDHVKLHHVGAARDTLQWSKPLKNATEAVVVAAPAFGTWRGTEGEWIWKFGPLEGTAREGEEIRKALNASIISDADATEQRVRELVSPLILHIATHGLFQEQPELPAETPWQPDNARRSDALSPMYRSALILAGVNESPSAANLAGNGRGGLLFAASVAEMNLEGTRLVTLSACETGLGDTHSGEGVLGLRRAFALAGARTLVMSLWQVPDKETCDLMLEFYQQLMRNEPMGVAEALQVAQRSIREKRPHPYYWAAFVCEGDGCPISLNAACSCPS